MKHKPHISEQIRKHWFLIGILVTIVLSSIHPDFGTKDGKVVNLIQTYTFNVKIIYVLGPLNPEFTVKYVAVTLIFLISGLSLKTDSLLYTLKQYRLHLFVQIYTFILIPVFLQVIVKFLGFLNINGWILKG